MELTTIKNSIHEIRGKNVILDFQLAQMYQTETKRLKESVRRNSRRFPSDFMFELTAEEWGNLRTQFASSSWGGQRYLPFAFTEQGVAMLSSVLNSEIAIDVNIEIMRAFVMIRQWAFTHQELSEKLTALEKQHQQKFKDIDQVLTYLLQKDQAKINPAPREKVGYKK
ncbi:MAG: hypothetical protein RLZZ531_2083 [Bacteroidota bacterium]